MKKHNLFILATLITIAGCNNDSQVNTEENCNCNDDEQCVEGHCEKITQTEVCTPACPEGQVCKNGKCAICIGDDCYVVGGGSPEDKSECSIDKDCGDNRYCDDEKCYDNICNPACTEGEICKHA